MDEAELTKWKKERLRPDWHFIGNHKYGSEAGPSGGELRMARVVDEAENWRRLYEAKSLECARLQKECEDQARLNGMGSERELALMAEVARLQKRVEELEGRK